MPAQSIKPMKRLGLTAYHCHGVWVLLVRQSDYGKVIMDMLVDFKLCSECKEEVDMVVPNNCGDGKHKWHYPESDAWDMCCTCGLDVDV